jgi:hypothetical protein
MLTGLVRFPTSSGEVAARWVTPARFWWFPVKMK